MNLKRQEIVFMGTMSLVFVGGFSGGTLIFFCHCSSRLLVMCLLECHLNCLYHTAQIRVFPIETHFANVERAGRDWKISALTTVAGYIRCSPTHSLWGIKWTNWKFEPNAGRRYVKTVFWLSLKLGSVWSVESEMRIYVLCTCVNLNGLSGLLNWIARWDKQSCLNRIENH